MPPFTFYRYLQLMEALQDNLVERQQLQKLAGIRINVDFGFDFVVNFFILYLLFSLKRKI